MENYQRGSTDKKFQCVKYGFMEYGDFKGSIARESRVCEEIKNSLRCELSQIRRMKIENFEKHHENTRKIHALKCEITRISGEIRDLTKTNNGLNDLRITPPVPEQ